MVIDAYCTPLLLLQSVPFENYKSEIIFFAPCQKCQIHFNQSPLKCVLALLKWSKNAQFQNSTLVLHFFNVSNGTPCITNFKLFEITSISKEANFLKIALS